MKKIVGLLVVGFFMAQCQEKDPEPAPDPSGNNTTTPPANTAWTIPSNEVFDGGPGKDGIPSIDDPQFGSINAIDGDLDENDLVIVVEYNDEYRIYPHNILDYHEIVNDAFDEDLFLAITYCPLTGTAIGWNREVEGTVTTFGVSGLLFNSNLMPYDRYSDSYWSQMLNSGVKGLRASTEIDRYPMIEMKWQEASKRFSDAQVLTRNTGFSRPYDSYPYGRYRSVEDLLFPVKNKDDQVFAKERVHGIQSGANTKVYQLDHFSDQQILVDEFQGQQVVLFGDSDAGFIVSYFNRELDGEKLVFQSFESTNSDIIATDQFENSWNLFGEAVSGPHAGEKLTPTSSYMGFYFAWIAFNDSVEIYTP